MTATFLSGVDDPANSLVSFVYVLHSSYMYLLARCFKFVLLQVNVIKFAIELYNRLTSGCER